MQPTVPSSEDPPVDEEQRLDRLSFMVMQEIDRSITRDAPDATFDACARASALFMRDAVVVRLRARIPGRRGRYAVVDAGYATAWGALWAAIAPAWVWRRWRHPRRRCAVLQPIAMFPNLARGVEGVVTDFEHLGTWPEDAMPVRRARAGLFPIDDEE